MGMYKGLMNLRTLSYNYITTMRTKDRKAIARLDKLTLDILKRCSIMGMKPK